MATYTPELQRTARLTDQYSSVVRALEKCNFCDLREKYLIAEKNNVVLAVNLFPYTDYQLLIIPRRHIEKFHQLKEEEWRAVSYLSNLAFDLHKKFFGIEDVNLLYREGDHSQKSVKHLHFNLIPFRKDLVEWNYREISVAPVEAAEAMREALEMRERRIEFMRQACRMANFASCLYRVGCVAVRDGEILFKTFNETLPGEIYCQNGDECIRKRLGLKNGNQIYIVCTSHAEVNLIAEAAAAGISLSGCEVYVSTFPCVICSKALTKAKVGKLFYMHDYVDNEGKRYFEATGIPVEQIKEANVWGREE